MTMTTTDNNAHRNDTEKQRLVIRASRFSLAFATQDITYPATTVNFAPYNVKGTMSMAANLREAIKTSEMLARNYAKVTVMADSPTLAIPLDLFDTKDAQKLFCHSHPDSSNDIVMHTVLAELNAAMLFAVKKDFHNVIIDRYGSASFFASSAPVWNYLFRRNFLGSRIKLYAYFHDQRMEVIAYGQNRFKYFNTFETENAHDAVYFLLSVWKQLALRPDHDELHMVGELPDRQWLEDELKEYLKKVYTVNPSTDFNRSPIAQMKDMPYDMMTYFIKGRG